MYGGRADVQWASGLPSPYEHLWSLPMRTLDPDLDELEDVLDGPHGADLVRAGSRASTSGRRPAPTSIRDELLDDYRLVAIACSSYRVYAQRDVERPEIRVDCDRPFDKLVLP